MSEIIERLDAKPYDWGEAPRMRATDFHSQFGGMEWRYDASGIYTRDGGPFRSRGEPLTVLTALDLHGDAVFAFSLRYGVPMELLLMTIGTETAFARRERFTGPRTFRWEAHIDVEDVEPPTIGDYSGGPMQTLATTARWVIRKQAAINYGPFDAAPYYRTRPDPHPRKNTLYNPVVNIDIGTAEIVERWRETLDDPVLVAAAFNTGGVYRTSRNRWHIRAHGDHLERAVGFYGDACAVLAELRGEDARRVEYVVDLTGQIGKTDASTEKDGHAFLDGVPELLLSNADLEPEEYAVHDDNEHNLSAEELTADIEAAEAAKALSYEDFVASLGYDDTGDKILTGDGAALLNAFSANSGNYFADFKAFIENLDLRHFRPHEFLVLGGQNKPGGRCAGRNSLPPRELWPRLVSTALMIDEIRRRLGAAVTITSGFRSNSYNRCIDGKPGSLHKRFNALDWRCSGGTVSEWHRVAKEVRRSNTRFVGGIGRYSSGMIHIDTRGREANW